MTSQDEPSDGARTGASLCGTRLLRSLRYATQMARNLRTALISAKTVVINVRAADVGGPRGLRSFHTFTKTSQRVLLLQAALCRLLLLLLITYKFISICSETKMFVRHFVYFLN